MSTRNAMETRELDASTCSSIIKVGIMDINHIDLLRHAEFVDDGRGLDYQLLVSCPKALKKIQLRVYHDGHLYVARFSEDTKEILSKNMDEFFNLPNDTFTFTSKIPFASFSIKSFVEGNESNLVVAYDMILDLITTVKQFYTMLPKIVEYVTSLDAPSESEILEFYGLKQKIECNCRYTDEMIVIASRMFDLGLFKKYGLVTNELLHLIIYSIYAETHPD